MSQCISICFAAAIDATGSDSHIKLHARNGMIIHEIANVHSAGALVRQAAINHCQLGDSLQNRMAA